MNKQQKTILTAFFTIAILSITVTNDAQANESKEKETQELKLFKTAKISLIDAIKAAEQKTGGKTMEAEVKYESETIQFEIDVLKDGKIHEVIVDGKTGNVLKVSLDDEANEDTENEKE
ncbi:MAG: PepSY domain-containing protein [Methylococcaceae bacterium]